MLQARTFIRAGALLLLLGVCLFLIELSRYPASEGFSFAADHTDALLDQKICLVGDTGKGNRKAHVLSRSLVHSKCTEVRILGDLIYPDGLHGADDPQYIEKFAKPFATSLRQGLPFYLLQGNHDYENGAPGAWLEIAAREPLLHYPAPSYAEYRGGLCIVSIDSTVFEKVYRLQQRLSQNDWLGQVHERMGQNCKFSLLLAHHPFQSPGRHGEAVPLLRLFFENQVMGQFDALIAGHDHILADVGPYKGTEQFITGTGSKVDYLTTTHPDTPYAEAEIGFIALSFSRAGDALLAEVEFMALIDDRLERRWHRKIVGQGWRRRS